MAQTTVADAQGAIFAGVFDPSVPYHIDSFVNEEASAEIAFGLLVIKGTADDGALVVVDGTGNPAGVVVHSHRYAQGGVSLGTTGLKPDAEMGVMREGKIAVTVEDAVTPADPVRVRHGGAGTIGGFLTGATMGETVPLNNAEFLSSAGAGEVAWLKLNGPLTFGTPD